MEPTKKNSTDDKLKIKIVLLNSRVAITLRLSASVSLFMLFILQNLLDVILSMLEKNNLNCLKLTTDGIAPPGINSTIFS